MHPYSHCAIEKKSVGTDVDHGSFRRAFVAPCSLSRVPNCELDRVPGERHFSGRYSDCDRVVFVSFNPRIFPLPWLETWRGHCPREIINSFCVEILFPPEFTVTSTPLFQGSLPAPYQFSATPFPTAGTYRTPFVCAEYYDADILSGSTCDPSCQTLIPFAPSNLMSIKLPCKPRCHERLCTNNI